jgi:hypothetical protein
VQVRNSSLYRVIERKSFEYFAVQEVTKMKRDKEMREVLLRIEGLGMP